MSHPVISNIDALSPVCHSEFARLCAAIRALGLPFRAFETLRTVDRQNDLYRRGRSKLRSDEAPHVRGAAVDFVLVDPPDGHSPWYTGVGKNKRGQRTIAEDERVLRHWTQLHGLIRACFPLLEVHHVRFGELICWDPYHVQWRDWRNVEAPA